MGEPGGSNVPSSAREYIACSRPTRGSETSQYPKERKSNETSLVAASDRERAQTRRRFLRGLQDTQIGTGQVRGKKLESFARAGDSPVPENASWSAYT